MIVKSTRQKYEYLRVCPSYLCIFLIDKLGRAYRTNREGQEINAQNDCIQLVPYYLAPFRVAHFQKLQQKHRNEAKRKDSSLLYHPICQRIQITPEGEKKKKEKTEMSYAEKSLNSKNLRTIDRNDACSKTSEWHRTCLTSSTSKAKNQMNNTYSIG